MKTKQEYMQDLERLTKTLGFNPAECEQGSQEWMKLKLGVVSASNCKQFMSGKTTATRQTYMAELVAQVATGIFPEVNAKPLQWGKDHEASARSAYELETGDIVDEVPFIFGGNELRFGISVDGIVRGKGKGLELKCPSNSATHINFLCFDEIKPEYIAQVQFSMWVTGAKQWDFASYDPRMKKNMLKIKTIERDDKLMLTFSKLMPEFIKDMDLALLRAGFIHGDQWRQ